MASYKVEGIILKRSNFGEAGKLITLFSRDHGKITLKAIGIRKTTSKRAGSLELFNHVKAVVIKGKGDLDTLTEVETLNVFASWKKFLGRITLAYQLAETVDKLTPDRQPHPEIFDILLQSLSQIGSLTDNWKQATDDWLVQIMQELGYLEKEVSFTGDIQRLIEETSLRPLHSPKLLSRLK